MSRVVRDKNTKKSLGYGFVKFVKEDDAFCAVQKMNGLSLGDKNLKVSLARLPSLEIRNCELVVSNLPKNYNEQDVVVLFQEVSTLYRRRKRKEGKKEENCNAESGHLPLSSPCMNVCVN